MDVEESCTVTVAPVCERDEICSGPRPEPRAPGLTAPAPLRPAAGPTDCRFREADYADLRRTLRLRAREQPFSVRAELPSCQQALDDVLRNAPLLRVDEDAACALVLPPAYEGWGLDLEGDCLEGAEERFFEGRGVWVEARPELPHVELAQALPIRFSCTDKRRRNFSAEMRESVDEVR